MFPRSKHFSRGSAPESRTCILGRRQAPDIRERPSLTRKSANPCIDVSVKMVPIHAVTYCQSTGYDKSEEVKRQNAFSSGDEYCGYTRLPRRDSKATGRNINVC